VPLVVRLEGTNVEQGKKILSESGLKIQAADGMADGAKKIVAAIGAADDGFGFGVDRFRWLRWLLRLRQRNIAQQQRGNQAQQRQRSHHD